MNEIQVMKSRPLSDDGKTDEFENNRKINQEPINRIWSYYSKILVRYPWSILVISSCIAIGLTVYFFCFLQVYHFDETSFFIQNGKALTNLQRIKTIFGKDENYRAYQQMHLYPAIDVVIKRRKVATNMENTSETNMLDHKIIDEVRSLDRQIQSIEITHSKNASSYKYSSLCIMIDRACIIDGNYLLSDVFYGKLPNIPVQPRGIYVDTTTGANGLAAFMFGKDYKTMNLTSAEADYKEEEEDEEETVNHNLLIHASSSEVIYYAAALRLRYSLNVSTNEMRELSVAWENKVFNYLNEKFQSESIELAVSSSSAISDTVSKQARREGPFTLVMLLLLFVFVCFVISIQGNFRTSVGYLSFIGILSLALSSGSTFALMSIMQIKIIEHLALIVFLIAVIECMRMSITCGEYHRVLNEHVAANNNSSEFDLEKVFRLIVTSTRTYFLCGSFIQIIVYICVPIISSMPCTKHLSLTIILHVLISYLVHCTIFSSCLVITLKRVQSRRHSLLCYTMPNDHDVKDRCKESIPVVPLKSFGNLNSMFKKIFSIIMCLLTLLFIAVSIWSILLIDTRLFEEKFLPKNSSSLRSYLRSQTEDYALGPIIMFVIPEKINYTNETNLQSIRRLIEQCQSEANVGDFRLVWIDQEDIKNLLTSKESLEMRITPMSRNDIIIAEENRQSVITASRVYCQYKTINGNRHDLQTMRNVYDYAKQSSIPSVFPYSLIFPHYESLGQLRFDMYVIVLLVILVSFLAVFLLFLSFEKALVISLQMLTLLCGSLACLYIFHNLSFNFANAPWLYIAPTIYLDTIIHATFNIEISKWKYNRVVFSLVGSFIIFIIFPIETYIFRIICYSLVYQSILCFILINFILPICSYVIELTLKTRTSSPTDTIIDKSQSLTVAEEMQNLVRDPNKIINGSI